MRTNVRDTSQEAYEEIRPDIGNCQTIVYRGSPQETDANVR